MFNSSNKVKALPQALAYLNSHRIHGQKVVFTNGVFDVLHAGHTTYLEAAAKLGDILVVGMNTDASVTRLKGPERPLNGLADRAKVLAALGFVRVVIPFDEDTPINLINEIRPEVLTKGADYTLDQIVGAKEVQGWGGEVHRIELVEGRSTTKLIEKIRQ